MLVARSRIPRVSSTAWGCPLAVPPGCPWAPALASRALRVEGGSGALWLLSRALPSGRGQFGLPFKDALRDALWHTPHCIQSAAAPQMYRSVGLRPLVLEHRNDKCDPCASALAEERRQRVKSTTQLLTPRSPTSAP